MRCTNNHKKFRKQENRHICRIRQIRRFFCMCCINTLLITTAGCGSSADISLDTPYQVYQSAVSLGMADRTSTALETHSYFGKNLCVLANGTPVIIELKAENQFRLTPEELEAAITPKTKLLVLPFPNNPTGAIMEREDLEKVAEIVKKYDLFVLSDEIYSELTYTLNVSWFNELS